MSVKGRGEIIVRNRRQEIVARINANAAVLHGHCVWYDGQGNPVTCGLFHNGAPCAGTFLNWANFFSEFDKENPFDLAVYCQDWISVFEASFRSEVPKYKIVLEAYFKGVKLSL